MKSRMNKNGMSLNAAVKKTAAESNVTENEVKDEISAAIEAAMKNPTPEAAELWSKIAKDGKNPTAEDLIRYIRKQL